MSYKLGDLIMIGNKSIYNERVGLITNIKVNTTNNNLLQITVLWMNKFKPWETKYTKICLDGLVSQGIAKLYQNHE